MINNPLSIAPMMDRTDRHYRYFMRQISRRTLLYTEMITSQAIIHGDRSKLLDFSPEEKPLVLQIGGDNPTLLAECAKIGADWGYDAINLNIGCPSPRVQSGNFGACLMTQPEVVAAAVEAMKQEVDIPVTVKHRIGVDECDRYEDMVNFVRIVRDAGCNNFTVHARKAWLQGLSPKENRNVPTLRYEDVYRLKEDFPNLFIEINGGITNFQQVNTHLKFVDGVMVGRAAYDRPYIFATVDRDIYGEDTTPKTRHQIVEAMLPYIEHWTSKGTRLNSISRHMLQLFAEQPGTKAWKRYISQNSYLPGANASTISAALAEVV
ncbi:tRNA dihydrouridine(20/20a) synthase DusA [Waterburya agarophytonicola K14]|uniref:tRNA-dihydrouridine(20/20a) synthase n=1 Tax=Waterburya agarophytonicola KI4 TaxID=2874699 RepID=A0A964BZK1_9CYAN|nr:tRNA dihydrouridine(20/20a) synthase DusA [Waterburya agarophytonicola]MCC0179566.1 tRNA dihydrouridine(20/20a) synthase DusA [Waterburya agarophytonicola KI4]